LDRSTGAICYQLGWATRREGKRRMRELVALTCSHRWLLLVTGRAVAVVSTALPFVVGRAYPSCTLYAYVVLSYRLPANRALLQARKLDRAS
jgi:hypothetical protein